MKDCQKKAFTLTELLVVVMVLGVLGAVAVPKFSRVLETRKTSEAEEMFAAVRTEQEHRCTFGKPYQTDKSQISVLASGTSSNYSYGLTGQGITASSSKGYALKMLSYKNGRICCEGEYCSRLNKNYPSCSRLVLAEDECAAELSCRGSSSQSCGCQNKGIQSRTCDTNTGSWGAWGECSVGECKSCEGPATQSCGCQNSGRQSRTCNKETGQWTAWGACSAADCKPCEESSKPETSRVCGNCGTQRRSVSCDSMSGKWQIGAWGDCLDEGECSAGETESRPCESGAIGTQLRTCSSSCRWGEWQGSCRRPIWKKTDEGYTPQCALCESNKASANDCNAYCVQCVGPVGGAQSQCSGLIGKTCSSVGESKNCYQSEGNYNNGHCDCCYRIIPLKCQ